MARDNISLWDTAFCGDVHTKCVHDLGNEKPNCGIDIIANSGDAVPLSSLEDAHDMGFKSCPFCIGGLERQARDGINA